MSQKTQTGSQNTDAQKDTTENLRAERRILSAALSYKEIWAGAKNPHTFCRGHCQKNFYKRTFGKSLWQLQEKEKPT